MGNRAFLLAAGLVAAGCVDRAPDALGRTRPGPGALVRYDLANKPLPAIPLPNDTATWPDPNSRTGLRINASLVAPTQIERQARERFSQMEGWGTFAPISVSFDVPADYEGYDGPAIDLANVRTRHQGDDYDFADDAIYLVNLDTGVPLVLDVGAGNFQTTLKRLDRYWANDTRYSERNLLFETIDETQRGAITAYAPEHDTDFDGVLDVPNFEDPNACPPPDAACDDPASGEPYNGVLCVEARRTRDRCVADNLLTWYERESDTLLVRPLLPLDEMTRYAVVITDRLLDGRGNPVKSPFEYIYHAAQRQAAERVEQIVNDPALAPYFGDLTATGLAHVGFLWSFTTQPTVDDMKRLRDGLYGQGPFARWKDAYPPVVEVQRMVGLTPGLAQGASDVDGWKETPLGLEAGCTDKAQHLHVLDYAGIREKMKDLVEEGFGLDPGPGAQLLLRRMDAIDHMVIGTFQSPFLLEGGPQSTDPNAAFNINFMSGEAEETADTVQFWLMVPKETAEHKQPFDVNIFGHGYTSNFFEAVLYAGNMAEHGIATIGINAMGHGLVFENELQRTAAGSALGGACYAPAFDALTLSRTRDLNNDGILDSGGDFWSSYLFHTRDGVRQSILDHIQLVRIMRAWGLDGGMSCRDDNNKAAPVGACDDNGDGSAQLAGDFDGNGVVDAGGGAAKYGTWGESLGGILSGIHGAIDAYVTSAVPGSGGGGLTDIGIRSFQGGVIEAVLLRIWGPLLVTVPSAEREPCEPSSTDEDRCTTCGEGQLSLRWVTPDVNGTGEVEIDCVDPGAITETTVVVTNASNGEVACARVDEAGRMRVGIPTTTGDSINVSFFTGRDAVTSYDGCALAGAPAVQHVVDRWGRGRFLEGATNGNSTASCGHGTCSGFQGRFYGEGTPLIAPAEGFGLVRQTPALRRFLMLAQSALDPGDPINFAPYYALKQMTDPFGQPIDAHACFTLNTIGDQNVPLNSGIAFARATGALPFLRPDQASLYPHYLDYVTPVELYEQLGGRTPNQELIDRHVVEGITELSRHPAGPECTTSANAATPDATYLDTEGVELSCYPNGCTEETESSGDTRVCYSDTHCDFTVGRCVPNLLSQETCDEALYDADDLDEGRHAFYEQAAPVPLRLARLTDSAHGVGLDTVWAPRIAGTPFGNDDSAYVPQAAPHGRLTALLDAYTVPGGEHTFVNGEPCQSFDHGTYLTNLVARFFQSDGTDIYYLSHPASHQCLATRVQSCDYPD
jgi:hypothetical protein